MFQMMMMTAVGKNRRLKERARVVLFFFIQPLCTID